MKAVLLSIRPNWCKLIWSGMKTVEVRKNRPNLKTPFKVYIYCTLAGSDSLFMDVLNRDVAAWNRGGWPEKRGRVIGEFVCDDIRRIGPEYCIIKEDIESAIAGSCLTVPQIKDYAGWKSGLSYADLKDLYGWHISDLKIWDKPVRLKEFYGMKPCKHGGDCCICLQWDNMKEQCCASRYISRPPQSWCYMEDVE